MQSPLQNWHNSISIALTIRNKADEEDPDNYHWLFWIVAGDTVNGTCAHANNQSKRIRWVSMFSVTNISSRWFLPL